MRKVLLFFALMAASLSGRAQSAYCASFGDYQSGAWISLDTLRMTLRSTGDIVWSGGADYKPDTGDAKTDKLLKKKARVIQHRDSLYVNCRGLKCKAMLFGNWYAPATVFDRDYILLVAKSLQAQESGHRSAVLFGAIGAAISLSSNKDNYQCYVLYPATEVVEPVDRDMIEPLLQDHPTWLKQYQELDKRSAYSPDVVLPLLQKLGLIDTLPAVRK